MTPAMQMMMPMMGGASPMTSPMMMNGMMPMGGMMSMPTMMCQMTCTMTANGMTCEMKPMDASMKDMFMQCCQNMMNMANNGMPMMMCCGGMAMMCVMQAKAA